MALDVDSLAVLDAKGYTVLDAITHGGAAAIGSMASPNIYTCVDGRKYWVKSRAQEGLVAELIAGRLAAMIGAGPTSRIIRVPPEAGGPAELAGVVVGSEDVPDTENSKNLGPLIGAGTFEANAVDARARARVIVFQTWLGASGDAQVLVRLTDGHVFSIDHGDAFAAVDLNADPTPVIANIPGVDNQHGKETAYVLPAVERIEGLGERDLLEAVAGVPAGDPWHSPVDRRLRIACWLDFRRIRLREVMDKWLKT